MKYRIYIIILLFLVVGIGSYFLFFDKVFDEGYVGEIKIIDESERYHIRLMDSDNDRGRIGVSDSINDYSDLAYKKKVGDKYQVVYNGKTSELYRNIGDIIIVDGKVAFEYLHDMPQIPIPSGLNSGIVFGNKDFSRKYDVCYSPKNLGNKLFFKVFRSSYSDYIYFDGEEYGKEYKKIYDYNFLGDSLYFIAKDESGRSYLLKDNTPIFNTTSHIYDLNSLSDMMTFRHASSGSSDIYYENLTKINQGHFGTDLVAEGDSYAYKGFINGKSFVVINGIKQSDYKDVGWIKFIDGKVVYLASYEGTTAGSTMNKNIPKYVVFDGNEYGPYNSIFPKFSVFDGKIMYFAEKEGSKYLFSDGEILNQYEDIPEYLITLGGHYYYAAKENGNWYLYQDSEIISDPYQSIINLRKIDENHFVYHVKDNQYYYHLGINFELVSGKYSGLGAVLKVDDKLYFEMINNSKEYLLSYQLY